MMNAEFRIPHSSFRIQFIRSSSARSSAGIDRISGARDVTASGSLSPWPVLDLVADRDEDIYVSAQRRGTALAECPCFQFGQVAERAAAQYFGHDRHAECAL